MSATSTDERGVADDVGDVFRAALGLTRSAVRTIAFELREVTVRLGRHLASVVVASIVAAAGLLLVLGALCVLAERFLGVPLWAGLGALGVAAASAGALAMRSALRGLADSGIAFPRTIEEFGKDVDALTRRRAG